MLSYEQALSTILEQATVMPHKRLRLEHLLGHVLAQPVLAKFDLPRFDNSAVDGFGIKLSDVEKASEDEASRLEIIGEIKAGSPGNVVLPTATALRIFTGAVVPPSVDAVVMREHCEEHYGYLHVKHKPEPGENIRRRGCEVKVGEEVLPAGIRVTPPVIGVLASLGYPSFTVHGKPRVALVITGDELVKPGHNLEDGQIYDSNSYTLQSAITALGIEEWLSHTARDTRRSTKQAFAYAIEQADVVISAGGVSVGDHDYVKDVLEQLGVKTIFWRIAIKPGKPVYFGVVELPKKKGRKLIFGLPGNPVSALVTFHQFVKPAILKMMGLTSYAPKRLMASLTTNLRKKPGRLDFVRGMVTSSEHGHLKVEPTVGQDSHMLSGLAKANCLLHFAAEAERAVEGARVPLDLLTWYD
jgi:molybdopterin molybdotransferase